VLPHTDKWVVDYDMDRCNILGAFGQGDAKVVLVLSLYQPDDSLTIALLGKCFRSADAFSDYTLDFGPAADPANGRSMNGLAGDLPLINLGQHKLVESQPKDQAITPAQEAQVRDLTVSFDHRHSVTLNLGSMGAPMQAMRTCTTDLVRSWGYDPRVQEALSRHATPIGDPGNWITTSDFPTSAEAEGHNGLVHLRLDIDGGGKIMGCHIQSKTSPDDFANTSCKLITRRAKFQPALDAAGKPVPSYYVNVVRWVMGG
jgi:hypothetical protein